MPITDVRTDHVVAIDYNNNPAKTTREFIILNKCTKIPSTHKISARIKQFQLTN